MTILQVSRMRFEPCPLRLQCQALTTKLTLRMTKIMHVAGRRER